VAEPNKLSRRGFVKSVAATAGAAALPGYASAQAPPAQAAAPGAPLSLRNVSQFPGLSARAPAGCDSCGRKRRRETTGVPRVFRTPGGIDTPHLLF